jgi:hypothetical protein
MIIIIFIIIILCIIINIIYNQENFNIDYICSKNCCYSGWPNNVIINDGLIDIQDIGKKYITTNLNCNNGINNTGCICKKII